MRRRDRNGDNQCVFSVPLAACGAYYAIAGRLMLMIHALEDVLMIAPRSCLSIRGISYFMHKKTPRRSMSMIRFHSPPLVRGRRELLWLDASIVESKGQPPESVDLIFASYGIQARTVTKRGRRGTDDAQLSAQALHLPTPRATDRVE